MIFFAVVGLALMLAAQAIMSYLGWRRANTFTVAGSRIVWDNARVRDVIFLLRLIMAGVLASVALPYFPDNNALAYVGGITLGFFLPSLSDIPVVLMKRWNIAPLRAGSSKSDGGHGRPNTTGSGRLKPNRSDKQNRSRDV